MEITSELLQTIRKRLEQVFIAKTNHALDTVEMYEDGSFYCWYSYSIPYGGTEIVGESITAEDLIADLDELVKIREAREKLEAEERAKQQQQASEKYEQQAKAKRLAEYEVLKKEFEK